MHNTWNAGGYPLHARTWNVNRITKQHENIKQKIRDSIPLLSGEQKKRSCGKGHGERRTWLGEQNPSEALEIKNENRYDIPMAMRQFTCKNN
jgi:hypothetical protein